MNATSVQELCARGQDALERLDYRVAEGLLARAEQLAYIARDYDALARLYMPLQESRRQIRLRCGEGVFCQDLIAQGPEDRVDGRRVLKNYPHGQLLVAGWASAEPAITLRRLAAELGLYVETFLAAVYPIVGGARAVAVVPLGELQLPTPEERTVDDLLRLLPAHSILQDAADLPASSQKGTGQTFSRAADMWQRLHLPYVAAADAASDLRQKLEGYRRAIHVDYAAELPHQKLSDVARQLARLVPSPNGATFFSPGQRPGFP